MNICHLVLIIQEGPQIDYEFMDKIKMSELLKPIVMACASFEDSEKMIEYAPEVLFIHNKLETSEMNSETYNRLQNGYRNILEENSVGFRYKNGNEINLLLIPDLEANENCLILDDKNSFDSSIVQLRRVLNR